MIFAFRAVALAAILAVGLPLPASALNIVAVGASNTWGWA